MKIKIVFLKLITLFIVSLLAACASDSSKHEEASKVAVLTLKLETGMETNLDKKGRANPILIRVYELKNPATFEQLDYFSLQDKDRDLLGGDIVSKDEFIMRPEEQKIISKTLSKETQAIGVMAAYQNLSQATWRKVYRIDRDKENVLLPSWSRGKQKIRLAVDLYGYDMIMFDEQMNRF